MAEKRSNRRFLRRPFWRDWIICYVLIGAGFFLLDAMAISDDSGARVVSAIALVILGVGVCVFLAIAFHAAWFVLRPKRRPRGSHSVDCR